MVRRTRHRASRHARRASQGRDGTLRTRTYAGRYRETPARCGRASSGTGTSGRQDARLQRAERWTTGVEILTSSVLRTVVIVTVSITVMYCSVFERVPCFFLSLDLIVQLLFTFSEPLTKKDRAARARRSKSGRKRPGVGSDRGAVARPLIPDHKVPCIDDSQFWRRFRFCVADASSHAPADQLGGA